MKNADVETSVLPAVIADLGPTFHTKDVSTDSRVVAAHLWATTGELNAAVGRVLSRDRVELKLELLDPRSNALWRKMGLQTGPNQ
jgi:hypothetical protein